MQGKQPIYGVSSESSDSTVESLIVEAVARRGLPVSPNILSLESMAFRRRSKYYKIFRGVRRHGGVPLRPGADFIHSFLLLLLLLFFFFFSLSVFVFFLQGNTDHRKSGRPIHVALSRLRSTVLWHRVYVFTFRVSVYVCV